jgi:hypothetical protein
MSTNATDQTTAAHFAELAVRWRADTESLSSPAEIADHPAYREIIAMREPAIWLILAELETRPDHWFEALKALTGEDPVPPEAVGDLGAMTRAWLEWGRQEEADRAEAMRITPSNEQLRAMMARRPASTIDYSLEDDELPC